MTAGRETGYPARRDERQGSEAVIDEGQVQFVAEIARQARLLETPCGEGAMVWHVWGEGGQPLVLLHGGYGSWTHWVRNVLPLSRQFTVIVPDLPGLGESATPPEPHTVAGMAEIIVAGLDRVAGGEAGFDIAGFSYGGVLGGSVAAALGRRARTLTIVGSNGLGLVRSPTALDRLPPDADPDTAEAVHRHNLASLMIADPAKIDALAIYLQATNAPRARVKSRRFSRSDALARALPQVTARLAGIWGERDATSYPEIAARARVLRSVQPAARFEVIPGAGHWVQYEAALRFNPLLAEILGG